MRIARFVSVSFITDHIDKFISGLGHSEEAFPDEVCYHCFLDAKSRFVAVWTLHLPSEIDTILKGFSWQKIPVAAEDVAGLNLRAFFKTLQLTRAGELSTDEFFRLGATGHVAGWAGDARDIPKKELATVHAHKSNQPKFALFVQDRLCDWEASSIDELMDLTCSGNTQDYRDVTGVFLRD